MLRGRGSSVGVVVEHRSRVDLCVLVLGCIASILIPAHVHVNIEHLIPVELRRASITLTTTRSLPAKILADLPSMHSAISFNQYGNSIPLSLCFAAITTSAPVNRALFTGRRLQSSSGCAPAFGAAVKRYISAAFSIARFFESLLEGPPGCSTISSSASSHRSPKGTPSISALWWMVRQTSSFFQTDVLVGGGSP